MPRLSLPGKLLSSSCLVLACTGVGAGGGAVAIEISPGLTPEYRWVAGPGFSLGVARLTAPVTVVWGVADPDARLAPPVRHGARPAQADLVSELERRLTPGVRYRVTVALADGRTGSRDFTPTASENNP